MGITTRVAHSCVCMSAAVRDVWARARGVGVSPSRRSGVVRLPSFGVLMPAAAPGGFWLVRVSRGVFSSSLLSLVCPRWHCGGVCGIVSCFFVAVGSLVGSCQNVACGLDFGLV